MMVCGQHAHEGCIAEGYGCGLSFCWTCMQPLDKHTNCKPWNPKEAYTGSKCMSKSELGRFIDSSSLFENHSNAEKAAVKIRDEVLQTQSQLQLVRRRPLEEVIHLERALDEVKESRRILAS